MSHTGPIIFSHPIARSQLVEHGDVVTFRTTARTVGKTWWRESRTGPKRGDVIVSYVGPVEPGLQSTNMHGYVGLSGFDDLDAWREAIAELNGGTLPEQGHIYRAEVVE